MPFVSGTDTVVGIVPTADLRERYADALRRLQAHVILPPLHNPLIWRLARALDA